jgi:hypothetical protein
MKKWSIYILSLMLLAACATDEINTNEHPGTKGPDDVNVILHLSFPEAGEVVTRSIPSAQENQIDSIRLFIFRHVDTDRLNDVYMYDIPVSGSSDITTVNASKWKVSVNVKAAQYRQRFVLVANPPADMAASISGLTKEVSTMRDLVNVLKFKGQPWQTSATSTSDIFPMWGQHLDSFLISASTTVPANCEINMIRPLAKVQVGVDVHNIAGGDPALGFGSIFKIEKIYVCNASDSGYIAPNTTFLNSNVTTIDKTHPTVARKDRMEFDYAESSTPIKYERTMENTIYVPETDSLIVHSGDTLSKPAFLVLKATYYDQPATYYRVDFIQNDQYKPLLRNHSYLVNITGIRKLGYPTLEEAMNAPIVALNPNLVIDETAGDVSINDIIYNRDYYLGAGTTDLKIDWKAQNNIQIPIKTNYAGGWTARIVDGGGFITSLTVSSGGTMAGNLSFNVVADYFSTYPRTTRTATIELKAGTLTQTIKVTQGYGSNSYIVPVTGSVDIPITSALVNTTGTPTVRLIWAKNGNAGITLALSGQKLTVNTSSSPRGPVVVGIFDGANKVLWSWLVWIVPTGTTFEGTNFNGYTFMNLDLGQDASSAPVFQWGRKDALLPTTTPLTYVYSTYNMTARESDSKIDSTILNPTTFYMASTHPYDWKKDYQNNNLWQTTDGEKGPYDPCPFGWRVPPANNDPLSPWNGFTNNGENGLNFDPARLGVDGVSGNTITNAGYFWSASVRSTDGYGYQAVAPVGEQMNHRANAYPIRCIRDNVKKIQGN